MKTVEDETNNGLSDGADLFCEKWEYKDLSEKTKVTCGNYDTQFNRMLRDK